MGKNLLKTWITSGSNRPFYARKTFYISEKIKKATVTICGLGQFNLYINGKKVSDHLLDPAWTDYHKTVQYLEFDVTEYLAAGDNVIAAEVGNGWYHMDADDGNYIFHFPPFMPTNPNGYKPYGEVLVLAAHLDVILESGNIFSLDTGTDWKVKAHEILHTNCFGSETVDGRLRIDDWSCITADEDTWKNATLAMPKQVPQGKLTKQVMPAVKEIKTYKASYMKDIDGKMIFDFGQNTSGMLSFDVMGKAGDVIKVAVAEKLTADGDVDQMAKNWVDINVNQTYITGKDDEWEHFDMKFTYFCARYIAVSGCDQSQIKNITLHAISAAGEAAGTFTCDDRRYVKIYDMVEKAVEANMMSVHTDCPTIERFAWQEENHLMAPAIMYMKSVKSHWEKYLEDTRLAQHTKEDYFYDMTGGKYYPGEGLIPSQAPCYMPNVLPVPGLGDFYDIIGWGSSIIIGTKWHYQFYGDQEIIERNYEAGKHYLEHLKTKINEEGFINHGLGDWGNPAGLFARENVETAFLYADACILKEFALLLGYESDAAAYDAFAASIKANYNDKLLVWDENTGKYCYRIWEKQDEIVISPATQAVPLYWGLVPEDKEKDIVEALRGSVIEAGSFQCGEVGQPYIIQTLSKYGMNDLICEVILKDQHPSYYAFILAGETSLGEYWEDNPRSHCHDMMGHIIEWYYNGIAGIKPLEPGFKSVLIKPYLPESMKDMTCTYQTPSGKITVHLYRNDHGIELDVKMPENIKYVIDQSNLK